MERKPTHLKKQPERNKDLQVKLREKLSFLKNARQPQVRERAFKHDNQKKNVDSNLYFDGADLCHNDNWEKLGGDYPARDGPEKKNFETFDPLPKKKLSKKQRKTVMKKIKKFLNPLVKSMPEAAGKKEEKIVLTYRSRHGCLIELEKNDGRTETLVDHLTTKKDSGSNKQIKKSYQGDEDHSLLGGAKQRSKSKEALKKQNQRARRAKNLSKEEMEKQQSKERARKKEAYERNKDEILSNRQNYYSQNKDDILSNRQNHYSQNKDDILSNRQNHYSQNKDEILSNKQNHYSQNKDDI